MSEQCGIAARKLNKILSLIRMNTTYRDKRLIIPLYKSLDIASKFGGLTCSIIYISQSAYIGGQLDCAPVN